MTEEGATKTSVIDHYPGPGGAVCWSSEGGEKYTRNIPGIDGTLTAVEQNGQAPVLQLHDLQGDIVATAALSETETKLLSTYNSTEFGVPTTSSPPPYSWLGASGLKTEFATGATASTGAGYVPQLGRPLQTQPIDPPGSNPVGTWGSGPYAGPSEAWTGESGAAWGAESTAREAARQQKAAEEAAEKADVGCPIASMCVEPEENVPEEEEGEGEEEFPDPEKKNHGEYGHLFIHYEEIKCNEYDCSAVFSVNGTLTDTGRNSTGMQLKISEYVPDAGWQSYEEMAPVENFGRTPSYNIGKLIIPYGYAFVFELKVRVGKHRETLRTEFISVEGEGVV